MLLLVSETVLSCLAVNVICNELCRGQQSTELVTLSMRILLDNTLRLAYDLHDLMTLLQGWSIRRAMLWTPEILGHDAPASRFSEARALDTVKALSEDIGIRLVRAYLLMLMSDTSHGRAWAGIDTNCLGFATCMHYRTHG